MFRKYALLAGPIVLYIHIETNYLWFSVTTNKSNVDFFSWSSRQNCFRARVHVLLSEEKVVCCFFCHYILWSMKPHSHKYQKSLTQTISRAPFTPQNFVTIFYSQWSLIHKALHKHFHNFLEQNVQSHKYHKSLTRTLSRLPWAPFSKLYSHGLTAVLM